MRVKHLIKQLQKFDPELFVAVEGIDCGFCDVGKIKARVLERNITSHGDYGGSPHDVPHIHGLGLGNPKNEYMHVIIHAKPAQK